MNNLSKSLFNKQLMTFVNFLQAHSSDAVKSHNLLILGPSKILQIAKSIGIDYKSIKVQRKSADLRDVYQ